MADVLRKYMKTIYVRKILYVAGTLIFNHILCSVPCFPWCPSDLFTVSTKNALPVNECILLIRRGLIISPKSRDAGNILCFKVGFAI